MAKTDRVERYAVVSHRAAAEFNKLPLPVRGLLKLCDGTRTLEAISQGSALPIDRAAHVLERLVSLGVVAVQRTAEKQRPRRLTPRGISWLEDPPAPVVAAPVVAAPVVAAPVVAAPVVAAPVVAAPVVAQVAAVVASVAAQPIAGEFSDDEERFFASPIDHLIEDL